MKDELTKMFSINQALVNKELDFLNTLPKMNAHQIAWEIPYENTNRTYKTKSFLNGCLSEEGMPNSHLGCESCIKPYELSEWAEKNYISKADIEAEKADMAYKERRETRE